MNPVMPQYVNYDDIVRQLRYYEIEVYDDADDAITKGGIYKGDVQQGMAFGEDLIYEEISSYVASPYTWVGNMPFNTAVQFSGSSIATSMIIQNTSIDTSTLTIGQPFMGIGLPTNAKVASIIDSSSFNLNVPSSFTGNITLTSPYYATYLPLYKALFNAALLTILKQWYDHNADNNGKQTIDQLQDLVNTFTSKVRRLDQSTNLAYKNLLAGLMPAYAANKRYMENTKTPLVPLGDDQWYAALSSIPNTRWGFRN